MEKTVSDKKDFTNGKVLKKLVLFAVPMAIATFLQMLFNAADVAIVGQFAGAIYQAAVGATSSTVHLIVNLFVGLAVGANVVMANAFGAKDEKRQQCVVHTSMATAIASGVLVLFVGMFLSRPLLRAIGTPADIIDYSTIYMQIYFLGAPALLVYNFGASIMRGVGETRKPLYYLLVSGVLNVIINAVTVIFFDLHVIGVALGTTVSQYVSAIWLVIDLRRAKDGSHYSIRKTRFYKKELGKLLLIGLPMGFNSCFFSLSNLFVQSSINAYGSAAIAGNTIGANVETFADAFCSSVEKSVVTFVGQNMGAKKPERLNRILGAGLVASGVCSGLYTLLMGVAGRYVSMIYSRDPVVLDWAMKRILVISMSNLLITPMYCYGGALRGMGYSLPPTFINLFFTCVGRIVYLLFIYSRFASQAIWQVYIVYPITWLLSSTLQMTAFYICAAKEKRARLLEKNAELLNENKEA